MLTKHYYLHAMNSWNLEKIKNIEQTSEISGVRDKAIQQDN